MKQVLIAIAIIIGLSSSVAAQSKNTTHKKTTKKHITAKSTTLNSSSKHAALNQRKEYHWKDGQSATPTGNEATGINETQRVSKDTKKTGGNKGSHN